MARTPSPPILSKIRGAQTYSDQVAALRALKDETIGHAQRKEQWVEYGVLESLVNFLQHNPVKQRSPKGLSGKEVHGYVGQSRDLTDDELVQLQSLQLLASFASGGPSFLAPIHAVGAIPVILSYISPFEHPPQLVLTALRALSNITDAAALITPGSDGTNALAETLFIPRYLEGFCGILASDSTADVVQEQKCLVASLISRLCKETHHQNAIANAGILDALATILASVVVARGEVIPGAEIVGQSDGLAELIPDPAPLGTNLGLVLEAIAAIIADSRFRAYMLLCSPAIMAVFPSTDFAAPARETKAAWNALEMSGLRSIQAKNPGAMDYLLPLVPVKQPKTISTPFPTLAYSMSRENLTATGRFAPGKFTGFNTAKLDLGNSNGEADGDEPESPLIPWLIHLARQTSGYERIMASSVVASLFKAGFANPEREVALGFLIVPLLCRLIKEHDNETPSGALVSNFVDPATAMDWAILERTPVVLARLIADSEFLQQAAYECGAMKLVCKLLKNSYEPLTSQTAARPWSPNPDRGMDQSEGFSGCRLGPPGQLPIYAHRIAMRESSLKLIAALVTFKNDYRQELVEQEVVPYIVESLAPSPGKPKLTREKPRPIPGRMEEQEITPPPGDPAYGKNPNSVVIAACHVLRMLGRSVANLRTALEDHGVAMPIFRLLKHPDAEVQIAACGTVCNLVTEFSPMREPLVHAGLIKVLCEHAHSLNPGLRLNSMWALKHLVDAVDNKTKKQCLEELNSGWLVQLICDDTEDEALHAARMKQHERGRAPLDADDDEDMDSVTAGGTGTAEATYVEEDTSAGRSWLWPAMYSYPVGSISPNTPALLRAQQSLRMQRAERKLATLREAELNPTRKARNDDLAIQEQGLGFIRNILGTPTTPHDQTEMVDYVFQELGQDRLFEILASKLRVKVLHPFSRRYTLATGAAGQSPAGGGVAGGGESRVLYPQAKILEMVIYILVHMAASIPRHRQLVIAQTELLKLLSGHFNSKDIEVRRALCHLFKNLVWLDDSTDAQACEQRALELRRMGFLAKLEALEQGDGELDIRERAREAVWQMKNGKQIA